jgi:hypothetical protein
MQGAKDKMDIARSSILISQYPNSCSFLQGPHTFKKRIIQYYL